MIIKPKPQQPTRLGKLVEADILLCCLAYVVLISLIFTGWTWFLK